MKVLFLSDLGSPAVIDYVFQMTKRNPGFAIQKFNRLLVQGLVENGVRVDAVSSLPTPFANIKSFTWKAKNDNYKGVQFHYIRLYRNLKVKRLMVFVASFFHTFFWGVYKKREKYIICDVLKQSVTLGGYYASKLLGIPCIALVTDMPGALSFGDEASKPNIPKRLKNFSGYIFLSEMANGLINVNHKPHVTFDGFVDKDSVFPQPGESDKPVIMFAGGIYSNQGVVKVLKAFTKTSLDVYFDVYGEGTDVPDVQKLSDADPRIRYKGVVPNSVIVQAESEALLLINPMPSNTTFARFSFPSKNMEYMLSGTPLLTTKVVSIPQEDYPYLYFFEDETVDGMAETLKSVLSLDRAVLSAKGATTRDYVLKSKVPSVQTKKILHLFELIN